MLLREKSARQLLPTTTVPARQLRLFLPPILPNFPVLARARLRRMGSPKMGANLALCAVCTRRKVLTPRVCARGRPQPVEGFLSLDMAFEAVGQY